MEPPPKRTRHNDEPAQVILELVSQTTIPPGTPVSQVAFTFFNDLGDNLTPQSIQERLEQWNSVITEHFIVDPSPINKELVLRFMRNARKLGDAVLFDRQMRECMEIEPTPEEFVDSKPVSLYPTDVDLETVPFVYCLNHIRLHAMNNELRKLNGHYYAPMYTQQGHPINYFKLAGSLEKLVSEQTSTPKITAHCDGRVDGVAKLASSLNGRNPDAYFPTLDRDRHVFSFANGVVDLRLGPNSALTPRFHPYGALPNALPASAAFHDNQVDPYWYDMECEWDEIPTPACDKVLMDQGLDANAMKWTYALLGRSFYEVNEADDWQVLLFIHGLAGTGKSTLLTMTQDIYDADDLYSIHTTFEKGFGLSSVMDKFLWVAPDVKEVFPLERSLLQSMVTGENIGMPVKYKQSASGKFRVPGLMAGNRLPDYEDTAGSVSRRFALLRFTKMVSRDDSLLQRMKSERAAFVAKTARAYASCREEAEGTDIWNTIDEIYRTGKHFLTCHVNTPYSFIHSDKIERHPDAYVPVTDFKEALSIYAKENNIRLQRGFSNTLSEDLLHMDVTSDLGPYSWPPSTNAPTPMHVYKGVTLQSYIHHFL